MQAKQQPYHDLDPNIEIASRVVHALTNPARLEIIRSLWEKGTLNVTELSDALELDQSTVSSHLRLLYRVKLVTKERKERFTFYTIDGERLKRFLDAIGRLSLDD